MTRSLTVAALLLLAGCNTESRRARQAAEEFSQTPEVQRDIGRQRARLGLAGGDLTEEGREAYVYEATHIIDSLLQLGDSTRKQRTEMYHNVGATRERLKVELATVESRLKAGERREDSLVRERERNDVQAVRVDAGQQFARNYNDKQQLAWLRRVLADSALPPE